MVPILHDRGRFCDLKETRPSLVRDGRANTIRMIPKCLVVCQGVDTENSLAAEMSCKKGLANMVASKMSDGERPTLLGSNVRSTRILSGVR